MGLVETLARERDCKVVLIFSRDNLSDQSKKALRQFRDKIFDREILLDPPMDYGVDIVTQTRDPQTIASMSKVASTLNIKNIRVLKKIMIAYDDVVAHVPELLPQVRESLMSSLGVLCYCHLMDEEGVPTVDNVLAIACHVPPIEESTDDGDTPSKKHNEFLRRAGWAHLSDSDRHLAAYVRDGICDWVALADALKTENNSIASSLRLEEIDDLWRKYRSSFLRPRRVACLCKATASKIC